MIRGLVLFGMEAREVFIRTEDNGAGAIGLDWKIEGLPEAAAREMQVRVRAAIGGGSLVDGTTTTIEGYDKGHTSALDLAVVASVVENAGSLRDRQATYYGEVLMSGEVIPSRGLLTAIASSRTIVVSGASDLFSERCLDIRHTLLRSAQTTIITIANARDLMEGGTNGVLCPDRSWLIDASKLDQRFDASLITRILERGLNVLIVGDPGSGKTMLARQISGALPPMTSAEILEVAAVADAAGLMSSFRQTRPFRAPHHTVSIVGLTGDKTRGHLGEYDLSRGGVLFLDELPEFSTRSINSLASRMKSPDARAPILIAAANPCSCGYGPPKCKCGYSTVERYTARLQALADTLWMETVAI